MLSKRKPLRSWLVLVLVSAAIVIGVLLSLLTIIAAASSTTSAATSGATPSISLLEGCAALAVLVVVVGSCVVVILSLTTTLSSCIVGIWDILRERKVLCTVVPTWVGTESRWVLLILVLKWLRVLSARLEVVGISTTELVIVLRLVIGSWLSYRVLIILGSAHKIIDGFV
jgi:hypothetical protein